MKKQLLMLVALVALCSRTELEATFPGRRIGTKPLAQRTTTVMQPGRKATIAEKYLVGGRERGGLLEPVEYSSVTPAEGYEARNYYLPGAIAPEEEVVAYDEFGGPVRPAGAVRGAANVTADVLEGTGEAVGGALRGIFQ